VSYRALKLEAEMGRIYCSLVVVVMLGGCKPAIEAVGVNGTMTQMAGVASVEDCPNGGVVLEHGIDTNENGELDPAEVTKTYVVCHGANGSDATAEIAELREELNALKAAAITQAERDAIAANSAKVGFPGFGVVAGKALEGTFTEVDPVATAKGYLTAETDPVASAVGYATENWVTAQAYGRQVDIAGNSAGLDAINWPGVACRAGWSGENCAAECGGGTGDGEEACDAGPQIILKEGNHTDVTCEDYCSSMTAGPSGLCVAGRKLGEQDPWNCRTRNTTAPPSPLDCWCLVP
jgi:hypothetical protein